METRTLTTDDIENFYKSLINLKKNVDKGIISFIDSILTEYKDFLISIQTEEDFPKTSRRKLITLIQSLKNNPTFNKNIDMKAVELIINDINANTSLLNTLEEQGKINLALFINRIKSMVPTKNTNYAPLRWATGGANYSDKKTESFLDKQKSDEDAIIASLKKHMNLNDELAGESERKLITINLNKIILIQNKAMEELYVLIEDTSDQIMALSKPTLEDIHGLVAIQKIYLTNAMNNNADIIDRVKNKIELSIIFLQKQASSTKVYTDIMYGEMGILYFNLAKICYIEKNTNAMIGYLNTAIANLARLPLPQFQLRQTEIQEMIMFFVNEAVLAKNNNKIDTAIHHLKTALYIYMEIIRIDNQHANQYFNENIKKLFISYIDLILQKINEAKNTDNPMALLKLGLSVFEYTNKEPQCLLIEENYRDMFAKVLYSMCARFFKNNDFAGAFNFLQNAYSLLSQENTIEVLQSAYKFCFNRIQKHCEQLYEKHEFDDALTILQTCQSLIHEDDTSSEYEIKKLIVMHYIKSGKFEYNTREYQLASEEFDKAKDILSEMFETDETDELEKILNYNISKNTYAMQTLVTPEDQIDPGYDDKFEEESEDQKEGFITQESSSDDEKNKKSARKSEKQEEKIGTDNKNSSKVSALTEQSMFSPEEKDHPSSKSQEIRKPRSPSNKE